MISEFVLADNLDNVPAKPCDDWRYCVYALGEAETSVEQFKELQKKQSLTKMLLISNPFTPVCSVNR